MLVRVAPFALLTALAGPTWAAAPMTWTYDPASATDGVHKMACGVEGAGQVLLMLECRPQAQTVADGGGPVRSA